MRATILLDGGESDPIDIRSGLRQGCVLAPFAFLLFLAAMLSEAFAGDVYGNDSVDEAVYIKFRNSGRLFNNRGLQRAKALRAMVLDLCFADDMAVYAHSERALQGFATRLATACRQFGLTISLAKTEVMVQAVPSRAVVGTVDAAAAPTPQANVVIDGVKLKEVNSFCYLGGILSADGSVDLEISARAKKAWVTFGRLWKRVWSQCDISIATKVALLKATVGATLMYGCETWITLNPHFVKLNAVWCRCLRRLLGIRWQDMVTDVEVLQRAGCVRMETMIRYKRLQWLGHVRRMDDCRLPKRLMFGELAVGTRASGGQKQRWKDAIQGDFRKFGMKFRVGRREEQWSADAEDRLKWKAALERGKDEHTGTEGNRHAAKRVKRKAREATYAPRRTASATRVLLAKDNAVSATGTAAAPPPSIRRRPPASKPPAAPRRRTTPTPSSAISSTTSRVATASTSGGVVTRRQSRAAAAATSLAIQPPITTSSAAGPSSSVGAANSTMSRPATSSASGGVVTRRQSRAAAAATSSGVQPPITSSSAAGSSLSVATAPAARARRSSTAPLPSTRRSKRLAALLATNTLASTRELRSRRRLSTIAETRDS
jgi:hypothetical protein